MEEREIGFEFGLEKEYNTLKTKEHEDQVELRRLRTENRLLRQRIDNLEKETATLADRLIQDQVICAQKEEEIYVLRRDLSTQKQQYEELQQLYDSTLSELREFKEKASVVASMPTVTESEQLERIQQLSSQLAESKHRETELTSSMKDLREQIRELETTNRQLQADPTTEIQQLQEELIACKLREAESNLSMKELRQRVSDLDKYWQKHMECQNAGEGTPNKSRQQQIAEELMSVRLREAESLADLKNMKQKVMELETQNQILNRQLKRMDAENSSLKERLDDDDKYENELKAQLKEMERKESDLESKRKEDEMMVRIKDAEHSQTVAEMRQRIAELEIENQEMLTAGSFKGDTQELENRVADLQEEVMQLKMAKRLQSISSMALNHMTLDTESDYDTDDMDATLTDADKLRLRHSSFGGISIDSTDLTLSEINKLKLQVLDSSDGEGNNAFEQENGTLKRRTSKSKKKRAHSKSDAIKKVLEKKNSTGGVVVDSVTPEGGTGDSEKTDLTGSEPLETGNTVSQSETNGTENSSDTKEVNVTNTSNDLEVGGVTSEPESLSSIPSSTGAGQVNGLVSTTASNSGYDSTSSVN